MAGGWEIKNPKKPTRALRLVHLYVRCSCGSAHVLLSLCDFLRSMNVDRFAIPPFIHLEIIYANKDLKAQKQRKGRKGKRPQNHKKPQISEGKKAEQSALWQGQSMAQLRSQMCPLAGKKHPKEEGCIHTLAESAVGKEQKGTQYRYQRQRSSPGPLLNMGHGAGRSTPRGNRLV